MSAMQDPRSLPIWKDLPAGQKQRLMDEWDNLNREISKAFAAKPELKTAALKTYKLPSAKKLSKAARAYNGIDVVIQAGHVNTKTNVNPNLRGSTGAPGEVDFTLDIANRVSAKLRELGFGVKQTDSNANSDPAVMDRDWRLFLSIHYEADVHNTNGGFEAFPEPSTDKATVESQRIATFFPKNYFEALAIPRKIAWRNANTSYYYMWSKLSAKTPCILLECGVGFRLPKDHDILNTNRRGEVVEKIVKSICASFNIPYDDPQPNPTPNPTPSDPMPEYLKNLMAENGILGNEGKTREFFEKARAFDGVRNDLINANNRFNELRNKIGELANLVK